MTAIRHYDVTRGAFSEADENLDNAFVTLTVLHDLGGGVLTYPRKFDVTLAELRRLLAQPQRTPKPKPKPKLEVVNSV